METTNRTTQPRERILETAGELFFQQGYRATGINEVIARSGVAKATFYNHFRTKEDLCLTYLKDRNKAEFASITSFVDDREAPRARFLAVMESIEPWIEANAMRGCAFLNMVAEVPDADSPLRREGFNHYEQLRAFIRDLAGALLASDPQRYGRFDADRLADDYMVILVGAIAAAEVYHDLWPVHQGIGLVRRLIE